MSKVMDSYLLPKIVKNLSRKYWQKLFDSIEKSATDTFKTASKRVI